MRQSMKFETCPERSRRIPPIGRQRYGFTPSLRQGLRLTAEHAKLAEKKLELNSAVSANSAVKKTRRGFTRHTSGGFSLVELVVTAVLSVILVLTVGVVLVGGQRTWQQTYETANKKIKQDAEAVMLTFGRVGRKSNQPKCAFDYSNPDISKRESPIYDVTSSVFTPVQPEGSSEEVVFGDAVEFRYWHVGLDKDDTHDLMNQEKRATAYALFYIEDNKLKVDYGPCTCTNGVCVGAVPSGGGPKNDPNIAKVLAENVTAGDDRGAFSQTTSGGIGQGSIRINVTITDPNDGETIKVMTATLMRTEWPPTQ